MKSASGKVSKEDFATLKATLDFIQGMAKKSQPALMGAEEKSGDGSHGFRRLPLFLSMTSRVVIPMSLNLFQTKNCPRIFLLTIRNIAEKRYASPDELAINCRSGFSRRWAPQLHRG